MRLLFILIFANTALFINGQSIPDDPILFSQLEESEGLKYLNAIPYTGEAYFMNKDGSPMVMRTYSSGVKEGVWRTWHPNGNLYKEGGIKDGKEHGVYKEYYLNGNQRYEYHYDMGSKEGTWLGFYETGQLFTERNFKNGMLHGTLRHFRVSGETKMTEQYVNGKLVSSDRFKAEDDDVNIELKNSIDE